ncbi:hypothetical protein ASF49_21410 [Methylobacterium sp. Leaf104]|uniref:hypothetical protein n=1 Tax=Methylobacterium TaxID=407 RepID=UPI0006F93F7F|nr:MULTISPECIES: hypothetical protein [Methylobacterium]KQP40063.1 hypothetical protein ASF49_21410 [Methylobacterium sp. Leaf104]MCI9881946.1 hypothetical protein [Methylobacterium goesingense]
MRILLFALLCLVAVKAQAEGFAVRDLSTVADEARAALGTGFLARAEPRRLILSCPDCKGAPMIDLQLGRQTDGTEERVRSGQTSLDQLEGLCRARNPACRLSGLSLAPALGWVTSYPMGTGSGATAVILRDGDLLTIRALAGSGEVAAGHVAALVRAVAPRIIGR